MGLGWLSLFHNCSSFLLPVSINVSYSFVLTLFQSVKLPPGERATKGDSQVDKLPKIDQSKQVGVNSKWSVWIWKFKKKKLSTEMSNELHVLLL